MSSTPESMHHCGKYSDRHLAIYTNDATGQLTYVLIPAHDIHGKLPWRLWPPAASARSSRPAAMPPYRMFPYRMPPHRYMPPHR
jgi:hypothetical protein